MKNLQIEEEFNKIALYFQSLKAEYIANFGFIYKETELSKVLLASLLDRKE